MTCSFANGLLARPSREFAPAGDSLSGPPESKQRAAPAKPPLRGSLRAMPLAGGMSLGRRRAVRRHCARSCLGASEPGAAPNSLRYAPFKQRGAKSVVDARFARAPGSCASRRFRRGGPEQPTAEQPMPNATAERCGLFRYAPFSPAEERKALRPRAKHASRTDSAQLSDRSVAEGVLRGAARTEYRRAPLATRGVGRSGGALCLLSGGPESRSPAGAKSPHGLRHK